MSRISRALCSAALVAALPSFAAAQAVATDSAPKLTIGAFVDGYFAWDFGRPPLFDRSFFGGTTFTTQPARHNEFNINLAFVEMRLEAPHYRGRIALQTGTSVQSNYSGEPTNGSVSGASLSRMVQEAVAGLRLSDALWLDAGIFYSHLGMESWASRDNLAYTRSLVADYSPYYQSGVKMTWTPHPTLTAQVNVVNGWQNISENNSGKGAGVRVDYSVRPLTTITYYNLYSREDGSRLRTFNGIGARHTTGVLTLLGEVDYGTQQRAPLEGGRSTWSGWTGVAKVQATPHIGIVVRAEGYDDAEQVIVKTGGVGDIANPALHVIGGSVGVDVTPYPRIALRTEFRGWRNRDAIFPDGPARQAQKQNAVLVTSLSLSF